MTGTDLEVRQQSQQLTLSNEQLQFIANTEFVPLGLRGNLPAILACVATGRALGLPDMVALRSIHVIDGKTTYSAELMTMLTRQRGHSIQGEVSEGAARVVGVRADNGDTMTVEWTLAMAERAGLLNKQNWRKYPEAMLWARAVSQLCRELFADVFAGATYTPEELGNDEVGDAGMAVHGSVSIDPVEASTPPVPDRSVGDPQADRSSSFLSSDTVSAPVGGEAPSPTVQASAGSALAPPSADPAEETLGAPSGRPDDPRPATAPQKKKLDVLVARLSGDDPQAFKKRLYATIALQRVRMTEELMLDLGGITEGVVHWSPLRESLTRTEAHLLIDKLEALEK